MRRFLAAATVAAISFASFAGCGEQSTPRSSGSAIAKGACSPTDSTITWSHGYPSDPVLIGVYVLAYDYDAKRWASRYHAISVTPDWADQNIPGAQSSIPLQRAWRQAILADAQRTGQVPSDFGAVAKINPSDVDAPSGVPTKPNKHTFVEGLTANQYTMPFTVRCGPSTSAADRGTTSDGTVTASLTGAWASTFYQCGMTPSTETARLALRYCPGTG